MTTLPLPRGRAPLPWAVLVALLASPAWGEAPGHQRQLTLHLDPTERRLTGELVQPLPEGGRFALLDGLAVDEARCGEQALDLARDRNGHWVVPACDASLTLRWQGTLPEPGREARHGLGEAGTFLPTRGGWYPHLVEDAGPLSLEIHTPPGQRAVGSGSLVEEADTEDGIQARFHHSHTREVEVAAGPWRLREREVDGVTLRVLFPEALDAAFGETYLERAAHHLGAFQARLGRLPFASFSIAASPAPVGLAFPGFTLLGERVIPLPFIPDTSLPHEIMHAWWGAGVQVDYPSGNWAEALTTYLADHAVAEAAGEDSDLRRGWLLDLAALPTDREPTLREFRGVPDPAGRLVGYQHGALLFHMLRQRLGEPAFDAALRAFASRWMHRTADWQALEAAFSEAADEDLAPFFAAWRDRPGRPELALEAVRFEPGPRGGWLHGVLVQRGEHAPWPLAVTLEVETEAGPMTLVQPMTGRRQPFALPLAGTPRALEVDPDAQLLRHPGELPSVLRRLLLDPETRLVALTPELEALAGRALGRRLETRPAEAELDDGTPLLVVGTTAQVTAWRQDRGLAAPPAPREGFELAGRARLWMHPEHPIGLLSGDDTEALAMLAARLRHHGQRSHLVLGEDGETRDADTWPAGENPLRVAFPQ
ncbi:M1 family metallopeptidase [Halomonas sp. HK25]|uniref:M1 family metallopeptidase n=1 Tax=Halomonas sp. HK25 TaxID=3394321 RepID=UPI0039FCA700